MKQPPQAAPVDQPKKHAGPGAVLHLISGGDYARLVARQSTAELAMEAYSGEELSSPALFIPCENAVTDEEIEKAWLQALLSVHN